MDQGIDSPRLGNLGLQVKPLFLRDFQMSFYLLNLRKYSVIGWKFSFDPGGTRLLEGEETDSEEEDLPGGAEEGRGMTNKEDLEEEPLEEHVRTGGLVNDFSEGRRVDL